MRRRETVSLVPGEQSTRPGQRPERVDGADQLAVLTSMDRALAFSRLATEMVTTPCAAVASMES